MKYQCQATTKKGQPCKVFVRNTVDRGDVPWYCGSHYHKWEAKLKADALR